MHACSCVCVQSKTDKDGFEVGDFVAESAPGTLWVILRKES